MPMRHLQDFSLVSFLIGSQVTSSPACHRCVSFHFKHIVTLEKVFAGFAKNIRYPKQVFSHVENCFLKIEGFSIEAIIEADAASPLQH